MKNKITKSIFFMNNYLKHRFKKLTDLIGYYLFFSHLILLIYLFFDTELNNWEPFYNT